ncbi:cation diffusion facilitator family transporter [Microcella indica]|nr:cation diffusion facilitator family transporter [Microcella indica]MBU1250506.1 cation diffusion facilitator family transporter [Actinomycetota bacterium]MBU1609262.1 cation diffusion facilitator family transporter [Actinomycetota bacterium]MBU2386234.1 cation diffusion facilitator family transporter [Actinomycetota bacterium]QOD93458.1 cation transporter [Chryseoglobus sp. 28M-23]
MGSGHSHAPLTAGGRHRRPLIIAFSLTASYMVVEFVVGIAVNSLALISDAAHMATDVIGLGMALAAITLANRPATLQRTFGLYRLEVLAALANGVLLFGVAGYVIVEAIQRFSEPPDVPGVPLLVVSTIGLLINIVSFRLLMAGSRESLNIRGAYLEILADLLGSVGVIAAAVVLLTTGWAYADPIIGVSIGLFILPRTWRLSRQALRILLEVAPPHIDLRDLRAAILSIDGVVDVHDLHVWTVTSGLEAASGHIVVSPEHDYHGVLDEVLIVLRDEYSIDHPTIQCEPMAFEEPPRAV